MFSKLGFVPASAIEPTCDLIEAKLATAKTVHSVDRPADLVKHMVNPWFSEFMNLLSTTPHGWLRQYGPTPVLQDLLIHDQKSKIPTDWPEAVSQAVCRLIDSRVVLEHKGLSKQLGPASTETKTMIDQVLKRIERLENLKRPGNDRSQGDPKKHKGQDQTQSQNPRQGSRWPQALLRDYNQLYPLRCMAADIAAVPGYSDYSCRCNYLSKGGQCTKVSYDKATGRKSRIRLFHPTEWAGKAGRTPALTAQQIKDLESMLRRDNVPKSPP
jgi:hypothetical protein